ncbi:MAG: hypothetical protein ACK55I_22500, partial [bacterium]
MVAGCRRGWAAYRAAPTCERHHSRDRRADAAVRGDFGAAAPANDGARKISYKSGVGPVAQRLEQGT